jgi:hypothetical protein
MIRAEELMLGDWLKYGKFDRIVKVTALYGSMVNTNVVTPIFLDDLEPIPITPKILEKNGFKLKEKGVLYTEYVSGDEHSIIEFGFYKESIHDIDTVLNCELGFVGGLDRIHHCHIKYVHQLQHALKLCGINKNIKL